MRVSAIRFACAYTYVCLNNSQKRPKRPSRLKMPDFIRPRAVRETSGIRPKGRKVQKNRMDKDWHIQTKSWSELEKTPLGARFKKQWTNSG